MMCPVATSKLGIKHRVPCRMYSNSRNSTVPEIIGRVGYLRSRAWIPVFSSVQAMCTPCSWRDGDDVNELLWGEGVRSTQTRGIRQRCFGQRREFFFVEAFGLCC